MSHTPSNDQRMWHPAELPSKGRFYKNGKGEPLCPGGQVEYTLWTTAQEETLLRFGGQDGFIDKMLVNNLRLPTGLKYEDLLLADQFFLLMVLRMDSICPYFTHKVVCHSCRKDYDAQANLREFKILEHTEAADEPFDCYLPHANVTLQLRYLRVRDQQALDKLNLDRSKIPSDLKDGDGFLRYQYARQIASIDGQSMKFDELKDFVADLTMLDLSAIRMVREDNDIGYDLAWVSKCSLCESENESELPLDENFFRPGRADIETAIRVARESRRRDAVSSS